MPAADVPPRASLWSDGSRDRRSTRSHGTGMARPDRAIRSATSSRVKRSSTSPETIRSTRGGCRPRAAHRRRGGGPFPRSARAQQPRACAPPSARRCGTPPLGPDQPEARPGSTRQTSGPFISMPSCPPSDMLRLTNTKFRTGSPRGMPSATRVLAPACRGFVDASCGPITVLSEHIRRSRTTTPRHRQQAAGADYEINCTPPRRLLRRRPRKTIDKQ